MRPPNAEQTRRACWNIPGFHMSDLPCAHRVFPKLEGRRFQGFLSAAAGKAVTTLCGHRISPDAFPGRAAVLSTEPEQKQGCPCTLGGSEPDRLDEVSSPGAHEAFSGPPGAHAHLALQGDWLQTLPFRASCCIQGPQCRLWETLVYITQSHTCRQKTHLAPPCGPTEVLCLGTCIHQVHVTCTHSAGLVGTLASMRWASCLPGLSI